MSSSTPPITEQEQETLITKYENSETNQRKEWRKEITRLIRQNPHEYKILEMGKTGSHATHLTMTQFEQALPTLKKALIAAIFNDIDAIDDEQGDGKLKITTIVRWVNNKKRRKKNVVIKDENFVFNKLKKFQFKDLDIDENGTLDRDEMHQIFDKEGVETFIIDCIFDNIDANGDGDISIKEWFQWQLKFKKKDLVGLFPKKTEPEPEPEKKEPEPEPEPEKEPEPEPEPVPEPEYKEPEKEPEPEPEPEYKEPEPEPEYQEPEPEVEVEAKTTDNPKGKSNSWSRSQSVDIEFDLYEDNQAPPATEQKEDIKKYAISIDKPSKENAYPQPPSNTIYILSPSTKWRECQISQVLEDGKKWKIHYQGFSSKHDEVVEAGCDRITEIKPENVIPKQKKNENEKRNNGYVEPKENRIWCESNNDVNIYRECVVVQEKSGEVKLHFISYHEKYDCWVEKKSSRLKKERPRGEKLMKGDNLSCYSDDFKGWLEVEVIKVEENKNRIQLAWVGSNKLDPIWIPINSNRLSIKHKKHNAPPPSGF